MSRRIGPIFAGFHSHRSSLRVQDIINQHHYDMTKTQALTIRLSFNIPAAKIWSPTKLSAAKCNETRLGSMYAMLKRLCDLEQLWKQIYNDGVQASMPTSDEKLDVYRI